MNLNPEIEQMIRKEVLGIISRNLDLNHYKVFYFGSRVSGSNRERSDIDVGIEGNEVVPYDKLHQILNEIDNIKTLYKIDFVDFKDCSEAFVNMAKTHVEYIYEGKMNLHRGLAIEELKKFDRNDLSLYRLIYSKYKIEWKIWCLILIALMIIPPSYVVFNIEKWWSYIILIPLIIFSIISIILIKYLSKKTYIIIKENYECIHNLNLIKGWSYQTIQIIRLKMFRHKIKELNLDGDKSNVEKILVVLEYETSSSNYAYKFSEIITVLIFGVLFSSILSSFLDKVDDWNVYIHCVKQISVGTLMLLVMFIYLDIFIFKGITLFFRNRNKRLIQTIHNYLIEN